MTAIALKNRKDGFASSISFRDEGEIVHKITCENAAKFYNLIN
jgi:hypothetical protein